MLISAQGLIGAEQTVTVVQVSVGHVSAPISEDLFVSQLNEDGGMSPTVKLFFLV